MIKSARPAGRNVRKRTVLVFGEDENDTKAIAQILREAWSDAKITVETRKQPLILIKDAKPDHIPSRVAKVRAVVDAESRRSDVVAIVAHEDCDATEPAHARVSSKIETALSSTKYVTVAATPAWEIETWLMQWPAAFRLHVPGWRPTEKRFEGKNLGLIPNAKEVLAHALHEPGRGRPYRESDVPEIARIVIENGWLRSPKASSQSFLEFLARVDQLKAKKIL